MTSLVKDDAEEAQPAAWFCKNPLVVILTQIFCMVPARIHSSLAMKATPTYVLMF